MARGRKPGVQNIPKEVAKERVLVLLSQGSTITAAMGAVGRNEATFRQWTMLDEEFKKRSDDARLAGKGFKSDTEGLKNIGFTEFSEQFLDTKIFPHMQNWVDLLEGRDPSWLHPAMTYQKASDKRILINVPPEHAKSTTITANYVTYKIVTNPNLRVVIVSKTQGMARKFLGQIKDRLEHPNYTKMHAAFGPSGGYKADSKIWSADMIHFNTGRDSGEKDPTVQALGIGSQIYGARADLIILDDTVMDSNAHEWEKMLNWIQTMVITRLGRHGKLLVIGTRVAPIDLYRQIRDPKMWSGGVSPFTYFACPAVLEYDEKPANWKTLWARTDRAEGEEDTPDADGLYQKWDGPALFTRRSEVTPSIWAMVYQQEDVQEDSIFSPTSVAGCINGMRKRGPLKQNTPGHPREQSGIYTIMGLDPAMAGATGAVMISLNRADNKIYVLDCINMTDTTPQKIRDLIEEWVERYRPQEVRIEINAHQKAYALDDDLRNWLAQYGTTLSPHFTGKNKWDASFGVASMASLFGYVRDGRFQDDSNMIEFPSNEGSEGIKTLVQQLITWRPDTRNPTDTVMALWFAVIRARELMQVRTTQQRYMHNRWTNRHQVAQRRTVNLDEAFQAQWEEDFA